MAMTKAERERLSRAENDLASAKALSWPSYQKPKPMTADEIRSNLVNGGKKWGNTERVARGWFSHYHSENWQATYGCSNGFSHSVQGDTTSTQGAGKMFSSKADALRAIRIEATERFAFLLAKLDEAIADTEEN